MKIYVASSWKNDIQPEVVKRLRESGHVVYDFRDADGFHWSHVQPDYNKRPLSATEVKRMLEHPLADRGFYRDFDALDEARACVLVQPCGRSAHLELGYANGCGKLTVILLRDNEPPDLMYKMVDNLCTSIDELVDYLKNKEVEMDAELEEMMEAGRRHDEGKACYYGCTPSTKEKCAKCKERDCMERIE